eukprot:GHVS01077694.1.p1 GENE.GHVS01077694.1~~GHVS01077694.1.p1  ORF type:complete len:243 (+),score=33.77 GHVS01077694.1:378-1106(+)
MDSTARRAATSADAVNYVMVSRAGVCLGEYSRPGVPAEEEERLNGLCRTVLTQLSKRPICRRDTYILHQTLFSYIIQDGVTFLCASRVDAPAEATWSFLSGLCRRYRAFDDGSSFGVGGAARRTADIVQLVHELMKKEASCGGVQKIEKVEKELEGVAQIMKLNIGKVIERGEQIECLVDKTQDLQDAALSFRHSSRHLRRQQWWRATKNYIGLALALAILGLVSFSWWCGGISGSSVFGLL